MATPTKYPDRFTKHLRKIYSYYTTITLTPVTLESVKTQSFSKIKTTSYLITRAIIGLYFVHVSFLFFGAYENLFGVLDIFSKLEASLWMLAYLIYLIIDPILLRPYFSVSLHHLMDTCDQIWTNIGTSLKPSILLDLRKQLSHKWKLIFFHNIGIDYFIGTNYCWSLWGALTYQTNVYSIFPWKSPTAEVIAFGIETCAGMVFSIVWSFTFTFFGITAYHIGACLKTLTVGLETESISADAVIKDYRILHLSTRLVLGENRVSEFLLAFYLLVGLQQFVESYVVFQMIKMEAGLGDIIFLLLDCSLSIGRIAHSFYALSSVDDATEKLWRKLRTTVFLGRGSFKAKRGMRICKRKELQRKFRSIQPMSMMLGVIKCRKDFVLTGVMTYVQFYMTAILWP